MSNNDRKVARAKTTRKIADQWLRQILALLYQRRNLTRSQIIESTGLNPASVSHALRHLLSRGVLLKVGDLQADSGRQQDVFSLNAEVGSFVVLDLEGDTIRFALTNFLGDVRRRWEERLEFRQPLAASTLVDGIGKLLRDDGHRRLSRVLAVGVSYPGRLDAEGRLSAVNLGWKEFPVVEVLHRAFPWPLFLERDKHTCIHAESWIGAAQGCGNALFLIAEGGIGMGMMVEGRVLEGARVFSGEIGHWKVFPDARDYCNCGQVGCLEAIASGPNIVRQYLELTGRAPLEAGNLRVADVFGKARRGDREACTVLDRAGRALGTALSHAIGLMNPEMVILGGYLIGAEDTLLPIVQSELQRQTRTASLEGVKIVTSALGLDIRLKGCASLAFRNMLADPVLLHRLCAPVIPQHRRSLSNEESSVARPSASVEVGAKSLNEVLGAHPG